MYNITNFGAIGDGITKSHAAIQNAIDACAAAGGGRVLIPAGEFVTGTIYLKSHVELHLSAGASLLGSSDRDDYNADDVFPENQVFTRENTTGAHLVIAYRQRGVSITGEGTINGRGHQFFGELPEGAVATRRYKSANYPIKSWRPGQMIYFCHCEEVAVRHVSLINAPYWTLFFFGCEQVQVHGLRIDNPPATANGDGIDIDGCRDVIVSDCLIRTGDDSITLRASNRQKKRAEWICENVVVSNCVLSTPCNAIRVGVGDGIIRRCTFSNIVIDNARTGINLIARYSQRSHHGVAIESIQFSNFVMDVSLPFVVANGEHATFPAGIRDIRFSHFRCKASAGAHWSGTPTLPLRGISLYQVHLKISGGTGNHAFATGLPDRLSHFGYHGSNGTPALPYALCLRHLEGGSLEHLRVEWEEIGTLWQNAVMVEDASGLSLHRVVARQPQAEGAALKCTAVDSLMVDGCIAEKGTDVFLLVDDASLVEPVFLGNPQIHGAREPVAVVTTAALA